MPCPRSSHACGVGLVLWDEGSLCSQGGSVLCPSSSRICGVGLCHVPGHPACVGWLSAVGWGHAVLMGQDGAVSRVILAVCPVPRHARFTGGSALPHLGLIAPIASPLPVPATSGPQQGTKVAAGTPSLHVLLTPILMKSCGFWLRLAESVFAPW